MLPPKFKKFICQKCICKWHGNCQNNKTDKDYNNYTKVGFYNLPDTCGRDTTIDFIYITKHLLYAIGQPQ